jgi:hypothetical protein
MSIAYPNTINVFPSAEEIVEAVVFLIDHNNMINLLQETLAVIGMCGYNRDESA